MGSVKDFKIHKSELLTDLLDLDLFLENSGRQWTTEVITKDKISNFRRRLKLRRGPGAWESRMVAPGWCKGRGRAPWRPW